MEFRSHTIVTMAKFGTWLV